MKDLSISLNTPTKRYLRSRKNYILGILIISLFSAFCFRTWNSQDKTSYIYPKGAEATICILLTPENTLLLHQHLGQSIALQGTGITWDNILKYSKKQISIHLNADGAIFSLTMDNDLSKAVISSIQNQGAFTNSYSNRLMVSNQPIEPLNREHYNLSLRPIWPFFDGYSKIGEQNTSIYINDKAITIKNAGQKPSGNFGDIYLPENAKTILLSSSSDTTNNSMSTILNAFWPIPQISSLAFINNQSPWRAILFTSPSYQLGYTIQLEQSMNIEDLAILAKQLVQPSDLSTIALTLEDDSRLEEIVSQSQNTEVSISTNNGSTFLHAKSPNSSVHISQTGSYISISNVDMTLISDESIAQKLKPSEQYAFADLSFIDANWHQIPNSLFISFFSSLSIDNDDISFFW